MLSTLFLSLINLDCIRFYPVSLKLKWVIGAALLVFCGLMCSVLPWYLVSLFSAFSAVSLLFLIDFRISAFFLACLVPISADWLGFHIKTSWSNPLTDMVPLFFPICFVAFVSLVFRTLAGLHTYSAKTGFNKLFLVLLCWGTLLLFWSPNLSIKATDTTKGKVFSETLTVSHNTTPLRHDLFQLFIFANNIALFYLTVSSIQNESFHRRLMWCWILFGAIVASFCLWVSYSGLQEAVYAKKLGLHFTFKVQALIHKVRAAALGSPHLTSFVLNMFIGITLGMMLEESKRSKKLILGLIVILMMLSNLLTLTKGGIAGLIVMLHFFVIFFRRLRKHFLRNLLLMYAVIGILFFLQLKIAREQRSDEHTPRFLYGAGYTGATATRAKYVWIPGVNEFLKSGCLGLGVGTFTYATISPHAHSIYFSTIFDFGIVGIAVLLIILVLLVRNFLIMVKLQESYLQTMFLACCGVLLSMGVHGIFDFEYNTPVIWLFMGFYTATFLLSQKELSGVNRVSQPRRPDMGYC